MPTSPSGTGKRARYWDSAYARHGAAGVSWYQDAPRVSLALIETLALGREAAVIDVGGGASSLDGAEHNDVTSRAKRDDFLLDPDRFG